MTKRISIARRRQNCWFFLSTLAVLFGGTALASAREPLIFIGSNTTTTTIFSPPTEIGCPKTSVSTADFGVGTDRVLGRYTFTAEECFNPNMTPIDITLGFFTLTTADGSTITGNFSGTGQFDDTKTTIFYAVSGFVSGGTGRFRNVTTGSVAWLGQGTFISSDTAKGSNTVCAGYLNFGSSKD